MYPSQKQGQLKSYLLKPFVSKLPNRDENSENTANGKAKYVDYVQFRLSFSSLALKFLFDLIWLSKCACFNVNVIF